MSQSFGPPASDVGWMLSMIRESDGVSRSDLCRRTGWSRTALDTRLKGLQDRQLVQEAGPGRSGGGRRPTLWRFNKNGGCVVAVQLSQHSMCVATTNLDAEIAYEVSVPTDVREGPSVVLPTMCSLIGSALEETGIARSSVSGVGVGIPGPVDFETGRPWYPPVMPGWHDYRIKEQLEAELGWPCFVDNDVNLMAIGEQWWGLGRGADNFVFLDVTPGIRCSTICRGDIYRGSDGCAGEIGHIPVTADGILCQCGRTGCLEALAGAAALASAAEKAALDGRSPCLAGLRLQRGALTEGDLATAVERGDPVALALVRTAGDLIGQALGYVVNFYNPRLILIGGGVDRFVDLLLSSIRETVYRVSMPSATKELTIRRSALGARAALIGAAALCLRHRLGLSPVASASAADFRTLKMPTDPAHRL